MRNLIIQSAIKIQKVNKPQNTQDGAFVTISTADAATNIDHNLAKIAPK
jgi:hypothetical protein